ncbi:hypothetical protein A2U01_0094144, partial [Trifolium medium]|nr:hypothetical protein [Trifolium medium]
ARQEQMKVRDAPVEAAQRAIDEPPDASAWRDAPSFLRDAQVTEAPNLLSTCWCDAPSFLRGAQLPETSPNLL